MTLAVITQPTYLPWLGYFEQLARADVFVFLDDVQFRSRSWMCRNQLRTKEGKAYWLTVPVVNSPRETPINQIHIADDGGHWQKTHQRSIAASLAKAKYFDAVDALVGRGFAQSFGLLAELNKFLIREIAGVLGLNPRFVSASELNVGGRRTERLVRLCQAVGADEYYSAAGARDYMEEESHLFDAAGIRYRYQDFVHPQYEQAGPGFVSHLACIDMIANAGPDAARQAVRAAHAEVRV